MGAFLAGGQQQAGNLVNSITGQVGGMAQNAASDFTVKNGFSVPVGQSTAQIQGNQQALAQALLALSQGQGPNPAMAELNQATNNNIQQGTGMIASQKGINPALATRLAAENTGRAQQAAAANGATLAAKQQLAAQGELGNVYAQEQQGTNAANSINAGVAQGNQAAVNDTTKGLLNAGGQAAAMMSKGGAVKSPSKAPPHLALVRDIYHPQEAAMLKSDGGKVPGKAVVPGDSKKNDIVETDLSSGEFVLPRTVMQAEDPAKAAAKFVADHLKKANPEEFKSALKKAMSNRKGA